MKLSLLLLAAILGVSLAEPQGFFDGFRNFFRGNRGQRGQRGQRAQGGRRPQQANSITAPSAGGSGGGGGNHQFEGRNYLISWREGRRGFSHSGAAGYCRQNGMRAVSLDTRSKANHFMNLVRSEREKYFWTGGRVNHGDRSITWANGGRTGAFGNWSPTGGARRAQPDNREGNEFCMGVLNNFYGDGVKYHDIACHHRKPVICEQN